MRASAGHEVHDEAGATLGMWLFLVTEMVLFGGLFLAYSWLRHRHPSDFHQGGSEMNLLLGVVNTLILLTSSLLVVLSTLALRRGRKRQSIAFLLGTIGLGALFLGIKGLEWRTKFHHGLTPGSAHLAQLPLGEQAFFGLYFTMTGLHGLHALTGICIFAVMARMVVRGTLRADRAIHLENAGLFWHLVDIIWIFLLPLFYLAA